MRVAAVQFKARKGDFEGSMAALCQLAELATQEADLVVLPEMAVTGYVFFSPEHARTVAEEPEGPTFARLSPLARKAGCWMVAGFPELAGEVLFNSAMVIAPDGSLEFVYRKTLLYSADFPWAIPGDSGYRVFTTKAGDFGVGICMDLNDDAFVEWLEKKRPKAIAFPTNWLDQGERIWGYWAWRLLGVPSALVAANTWGQEEHIRFRGESAILRERTLLAAAPPEGDGVIRARL
ncbi:MAG: carbon-nitrogen hydrolase family protein [Vulcanimicrobiota bacterium]